MACSLVRSIRMYSLQAIIAAGRSNHTTAHLFFKFLTPRRPNTTEGTAPAACDLPIAGPQQHSRRNPERLGNMALGRGGDHDDYRVQAYAPKQSGRRGRMPRVHMGARRQLARGHGRVDNQEDFR